MIGMKLDPYTLSLISFFKDPNEYNSFDESLDRNKWERVNTFYRWQLIRLNPEYKKFYKKVTSKPGNEILPEHAKKTIFNSMARHWNMNQLLEPSITHPQEDFSFLEAKQFSEVGTFSYQDLYDEEMLTDFEDTLAGLATSSFTEMAFDPTQHPDDRRFMIIAFDLKSKFTKDSFNKLGKVIEIEQEKYVELQKISGPLSQSYSPSMLDIEKSIYVRRYYDKLKSLNGISKAFKNRYGSGSDYERSSLRQRKERIDEYIQKAKAITLNITKII